MRLRLFERLGQLGSWLSGSRAGRYLRPRDTRAGSEASGRHRRHPSAGQPVTRVTVGTQGRQQSRPPLQPPAVLPRRPDPSAGPGPRPAGTRVGGAAMPPLPRSYRPGPGGGTGRARIREAPVGTAPVDAVARPQGPPAPAAPRQAWYQVVDGPAAARRLVGQARVAGEARVNGRAVQAKVGRANPAQVKAGQAAPDARQAPGARALLPFAAPHPRDHPLLADGRRDCGPLEQILWRQWESTAPPPPQVVAAIDRLAEFPLRLQEKLAAGLDGIYVGDGGVPDLDHMGQLHGVALPSGKATWDACAGAYGDRKIVVGTRPSPTPDVMCHEIGHALDDLDSPPGKWQSDSAEFRVIYDQCQPFIASDFHRQRGGLGRKEFFADAFAAIASSQRPALVDMLGGNTRIALRVMLYFNRRYGI